MSKYYIIILVCLYALSTSATQKRPESRVFDILNLNHPGLEKVKSLHLSGKDKEAAGELLKYYRKRKGVNHPDISLQKINISNEEQRWADEALEHTFFAHKGYQPSFNYGEDIDWRYWPIKDNELRWQLHRTKWWQPMGKAYYLTKDEKYAREWVHQYLDWIDKNPLLAKPGPEASEQEREDFENVRFAWRPLEVSHRLQDQTIQFLLFIQSPSFTPEFLTHFLYNYHKHGQRIISHYSNRGNHLLFEAQRIIYAGTFFPELKEATTWRKSGIDVLNKEIELQVYDDGMQYELDPHYHLAAINIFYKAIRIAESNGFHDEFPHSYFDTLEKMILWVINCYFPDYTNPMFSDAKLDTKKEMLRNYRNWLEVFPNNTAIQYMATQGKRGSLPNHLSTAFKTSGFYVFRNGWRSDATQMVLKAGPPAFWHCQPDNGTFELYVNGRNFFPDTGSYVYGGDKEVEEERNWFRQTKVHKTLTLNGANIDSTDSRCLLWKTEQNPEILVYENPSYDNLTHRRSVYFVDNTFFVITDEAYNKAQGNVAIHYQMCEGDFLIDKNKKSGMTNFKDGNNVFVQCFGSAPIEMKEEEGWVSYEYRKKAKRVAYSFSSVKKEEPVRFITVIYPIKDKASAPNIEASFITEDFTLQSSGVFLKINGNKYELKYSL